VHHREERGLDITVPEGGDEKRLKCHQHRSIDIINEVRKRQLGDLP
jgi:hypothetical protein